LVIVIDNPVVHRRHIGVRSAVSPPRPNKGSSIVRIRFALALMVAGLLCAAGIASAQDTNTTATGPTSGYSTSTSTQEAATTQQPQTTESAPAAQGEEGSSVAPSVAAQPAGTAPQSLAFTGAEPLLLIVVGLALAGGTATFLVRDRRRSQQ
jgi:hypothetical protein